MKNKITELRLRVDTLIQLTEQLIPSPRFIVKIPEGYSMEKVEEIRKQFQQALQQQGSLFIPEKFTVEPIAENISNIVKCTNSLRLAKARLGQILGLIGEESPYQNDGKRKTVADIETASDKSVLEFEGLSHAFKTKQTFVEKIDWLRETIKEFRKDTAEFLNSNKYNANYQLSSTHTQMNLSISSMTLLQELDNARFYLGFELGRIRDEHKNA